MSLFGKTKVETTDINKRFHLIGRVGQGSMSKVWRAEDKMSGSFVAVKVLDKEKTKRFEERFKGLNKPSEAEIAFSLRHPYIVRTQEIGWTLEEEMFLVMDYVEGSGLSLLVDLQSDDLKRYRIRFMIQIGEALSYFHKQNWIHRDVCPRNIMVTDDQKIRLIDFGLAVPNTADFCKPGNRTGTANYMAPELIKRRPTDQRIDVFAYAVTCYEMYANRHPWDAAQTLDAVMQHINQPPVPLKELVPKVDDQIAETIMKGLMIDPNERWQTIDEMVQQFRKAEVRLVKATKDLLERRKKKSGTPAAAKPSTAKASPNRKVAAEPAAAKPTQVSNQSSGEQDASRAEAAPKPKPAAGKASSKAPVRPNEAAATSPPDGSDQESPAETQASQDPLNTDRPLPNNGDAPKKSSAAVLPADAVVSENADVTDTEPSVGEEAYRSDDDILALPDDDAET